ncbi:MAG: hypothetical protein ABI557_10780 [Aureliella sp.]
MKNETPQKSTSTAPKSGDKAGAAKTHDGKVVSVAGDKLTSTCSKGQEHHHTLTKDAKVTCDGKASKLADLKAGTPIHVTCCKDDEKMVTAVESGKHVHAAAH